jgi:hypothetical protein
VNITADKNNICVDISADNNSSCKDICIAGNYNSSVETSVVIDIHCMDIS